MSTPLHPIDTLRDAFLRLLAEGMTHAEAMTHFDEQQWHEAAMQELTEGMAVRFPLECDFLTNDARRLPALLTLGCKAMREQDDAKVMQEQVIPLYLAGWTSEVPAQYQHNSKAFYRQCPPMSLYWRAPSKRPGKPGRKFLSTGQAFRAMSNEKSSDVRRENT